MQVMVVIAMVWEGVFATGRAIVAAAGAAYVPYTLLQYETMIDRAVNAVYFVTVAGGAVPGTPNPFVENLTDTNDELMSVFEVFTVSNKWNVVYTVGGAIRGL